MKLQTKIAITEQLADRFKKADTFYLTDFTGLDVKAMTELRARLREQGIQFVVAKNTLVRRAIADLDLPDMSEYLQGPTGIVFGHDDPVSPARTLKEFSREHEDRPSVKIAVVDRRPVDSAEVSRLADLPPRDQLLAAIAGSVSAPTVGIVAVLGGVIRDIAYLVEEVARRRQAE